MEAGKVTRRDVLKGMASIPLAAVVTQATTAEAKVLNETVRQRILSAKQLLERTRNMSSKAYKYVLHDVLGVSGFNDAIRILAKHESTMYTPTTSEIRTIKRLSLFRSLEHKLQRGESGVLINADTQRLYLIKRGSNGARVSSAYKVSTSSKYSGNIQDSNRTPVGKHKITDKHIGLLGEVVSAEDVPIRLFTKVGSKRMVHSLLSNGNNLSGTTSREREHAAVITGRLTVDAMRGVHIHGTNRVNGLGHRGSSGCIRMSSVDLTHLSVYIGVGSRVHIHDSHAVSSHRPKRRRHKRESHNKEKKLDWSFKF